MMVGVEACSEYVLPSVDLFFRNFVTSFGLLNIESKTMLKAFELVLARWITRVLYTNVKSLFAMFV